MSDEALPGNAVRGWPIALWVHRCRIGAPIPKVAIEEYRLDVLFDFTLVQSKIGEFYTATKKKRVKHGTTQVNP
jgi:hypothetical protein